MKLEIGDVEVKSVGESSYVRINIGGHMYFDTPYTTKKNADGIYDNVMRRVDDVVMKRVKCDCPDCMTYPMKNRRWSGHN